MEDLFEKAPVPKAFFTLALPLVLALSASMIYNLADTFFVSQTQNTDLVAGVVLCTPLFSLLIALGDMFGIGGSSIISRLLGQKDFQAGKRISSFCLYASVVVGILTTILLLVYERPMLMLFGANEETYRYASEFYRVMAVGATPVILSLVPNNLIRTEGFARQAMIGTISGTIITIVLDPLFIFLLGMGAAGAATATVIGYTIGDIYMLWAVVHYCKVISVRVSDFRITKKIVLEVLMIGIPASVTNITQAFSTSILNQYLVQYGVTKVAAMGIVMKVYLIISMVMAGFAFGVQPLVGYSYGARNKERFREIVRFSVKVEVEYSIVVAIILILFAPQVLMLFLHNQAVVHAGVGIMRVLLLTTPFVGAVLVFTTVFQSTGKAGSAFTMSIARQGVLFYLSIVVMHLVFGYWGVIWAQPVADVLTAVIGWYLYSRKLDSPEVVA